MSLANQIEIATLAPDLAPGAKLHLERLLAITQDLETASAAVDAKRELRNLEIAKAIDVHGISKPLIGDVTGLTDARINQILAEVG